jgi:hypothetical protein
MPVGLIQTCFDNQSAKPKSQLLIQCREVPAVDLQALELIGVLYNCRIKLNYEGESGLSQVTTQKSTAVDSGERVVDQPDYKSPHFVSRLVPDFDVHLKNVSKDDNGQERSKALCLNQQKSALTDRLPYFDSNDISPLRRRLYSLNPSRSASENMRPSESGIENHIKKLLFASKSVDKHTFPKPQRQPPKCKFDAGGFDYATFDKYQEACFNNLECTDDSSCDSNIDDVGASVQPNNLWIKKNTNFSGLFQKFGSEVTVTNQLLCKSIALQLPQGPDRIASPGHQVSAPARDSDSDCSEAEFNRQGESFNLFGFARRP